MSRSYKKTPIIKDRNKGMKSIANRKVRNYKGDLACGNSYRKVFQSYNISDYAFYTTKEQYFKNLEGYINNVLNDVFVKYYSYKIDNYNYFDWYKRYKMK